MDGVKVREFNSEIEFTNNGVLSFFFLGTGNAFSKELLNTNLLIVKGNDHVLVDFGNLSPLAFKNFNTCTSKIENIIITHAHADHIGGIEELALKGMYIHQKKPVLICEKSFQKKLWNESLKGGLGLRGEEGQRQKLTLSDYFECRAPEKIKNAPRPFFNIDVGGINIKLFRTKHEFISTNTWKTGMYSVGLLVDERIVFTGDTRYDRELLNWLTTSYNIEYIFHDCSFRKSAVHTSYNELLQLPEDIRKKTFLCHYEEQKKDFDPIPDGFAGLSKSGLYYEF